MDSIDQRPGIFFNAFADTFDTLYEKQRNPIMRTIDYLFRSDIEIRYSLTFEKFGDLKGKSILDIGCGSGIYLKNALENKSKFVCGVDPAENMLKLTKARLSKWKINQNYKLISGNFPDVKIKTNFNFIIVMGVMDYIPNPEIFINGLKGLYSESVALSFPSKHWFRSPIRKFRYNLRNCPIYLYDKNSINQLMKSCDIKQYDITKIPGAGMDYHVLIKY